ncbi:MAG TPA: carboxylating nicotinate-nucleotide diphosphorylase [Steroidobacteraceae bacterium]|nr:carboxylating nicotinate-nucleotide diphosphorylase [Steroidobacteraceae bacterium]
MRCPSEGLPADLCAQVSSAIAEDVGAGDLSAQLIPQQSHAHARVISRESAILCGAPWFDEVFRQLDPTVQVGWRRPEGASVAAGEVLCELAGPARALLTGERSALNFLQLLSATATVTHRYVAAIAGTGCRILDTRKTIPGLRTAQKYAVRCGGGTNHRMGLYDRVLIKENHIAAAGSIGAAVAAARRLGAGGPIEVEAETLAQVSAALQVRADIVLLDNFEPAALRAAVALNRAHPQPAQLEASGGVTLAGLRAIAETGVDFISIGALTKNVAAIDLSMRFADGSD